MPEYLFQQTCQTNLPATSLKGVCPWILWNFKNTFLENTSGRLILITFSSKYSMSLLLNSKKLWLPVFPKFHLDNSICNLKICIVCTEAVAQRCSVKNLLLEISQNPQAPVLESFSIKLQLMWIWFVQIKVAYDVLLRGPKVLIFRK